MELFILAIGITFLFFLIVKCKLSSFLSLILTAIFMAFALGIPIENIPASITKGLGATLGGLAIIVSLGAMLGKLMADSGAAQRIAMDIIEKFGAKNIRWAVCIAGCVVGFALFYEVGFILLIPIVFTITKELKINPLEAGIPMAASLSVTHGFLPPHPGPTAIANIFQADLGLTLIYGTLAAIPTLIIAGPIFYSFAKHVRPTLSQELMTEQKFDPAKMPSFFISALSALIPIILMALSTFAKILLQADDPIYKALVFVGSPDIALSIAVMVAIFTLGLRCGKNMQEIMSSMEAGVKGIAMILLVVAAGGALKQVLIDSGLSQHIGAFIDRSSFSPFIAAWMIAAVLRIAVGSASVAALTAGAIVAPLVTLGVSPELMVLAVGAGSVILSLPNDPGFWLFKEFFGLSIKQTLLTWTVLETIIAVMGLMMVLLINNIFY